MSGDTVGARHLRRPCRRKVPRRWAPRRGVGGRRPIRRRRGASCGIVGSSERTPRRRGRRPRSDVRLGGRRLWGGGERMPAGVAKAAEVEWASFVRYGADRQCGIRTNHSGHSADCPARLTLPLSCSPSSCSGYGVDLGAHCRGASARASSALRAHRVSLRWVRGRQSAHEIENMQTWSRVAWRGRVGCLIMRGGGDAGVGRGWRLYVLGVHRAHAEVLAAALYGLPVLATRRPHGVPIVAMGGWNIDYLGMLLDLGEDHPLAAERRELVNSWCDAKVAFSGCQRK